MMSKFITGKMRKNACYTIGVEFATKVVRLDNGKLAKAQLWDTAG